MKKKMQKDFNNTITVKLNRKRERISLYLFDKMLHSNRLIWSVADGCFVGEYN